MSDNGVEVLESARAFIRREAAAIDQLAHSLEGSLDVVNRVLATTGKVVTTGTGTSGIADDLHGLEAVGRFAGTVPVGVDGGVTGAVAALAVSRGAGYIVSGRGLFFSPHESHPYQRED
ncbi:hypothetical protein [Cryobacterium luteum]|uniref:Uncharacterized protein n=1 Tax=Cryobacterium luteum TaxID=1424661 RepID=A0A1H8HDN0_9MICO|nr:hypothetical protein [Cryobacterium luteum]TFB86704.1 hypothetical protein E3O10_13885 [Cryobacterium luteum]SEN54119.1 arabinose-5-phosphate isomerase [Cryobacterium luteum]